MTRAERTAWAFVAPVLIAMLLMIVLPTLGAVVLSLTDFDIYALADLHFLRFVGFANYVDLVHMPIFWRAVANTMLFCLLGVPAAISASLFAALVVESAAVRWRPLWRLLLFAPYIATLVATALVWRYVLDTHAGLLNYALATLGMKPVDWLGDPATSIPAIVLFVTWKVFGYNMMVFAAALTAVSGDLREAALLDGATRWARFRHVTLPAIGPALLLAAIISVANFLQIFTEPYVMTQGGPAQRTVTLPYLMFTQGFDWWNLGSASAVAILLFAAILGVTAVQARVGRRLEWW